MIFGSKTFDTNRHSYLFYLYLLPFDHKVKIPQIHMHKIRRQQNFEAKSEYASNSYLALLELSTSCALVKITNSASMGKALRSYIQMIHRDLRTI